jgi:hypothetical protein
MKDFIYGDLEDGIEPQQEMSWSKILLISGIVVVVGFGAMYLMFYLATI